MLDYIHTTPPLLPPASIFTTHTQKSNPPSHSTKTQKKTPQTALFLIISLFASFFLGTYLSIEPLVDISTRMNLALRIRFGALRIGYLVEEYVWRDYVVYPTTESIFGTVRGDVAVMSGFR